MGDRDGSVVKVGLSGGVHWPSFLHPGLSQAVPVCLRTLYDLEEAKTEPIRQLRYGCVLSSSPTHLSWIPPSLYPKPFKQYSAVEEGLKYYNSTYQDAPVPRALLREHLDEALDTPLLKSDAELLGNRLCAAEEGEGNILLGHPSGPTGDVPTLTVLQRQPDGILQCAQVSYLPGNAHAIFQVAFSNRSGHPKAPELPLLATRSDYLITVYRVVGTQPYDNDGNLLEDLPMDWSLRQVGSLQTKSRICHMSWNRALHDELAFTCEDGSLGLVYVFGGAPGSRVPDLRPWFVKGPHQGENPPGISTCEWGCHPRLLYCLSGCKVLCLDMRSSREAVISVLHTRPDGEPLVSLACGSGPKGRNLMALASSRNIVLLDVRQPSRPLLTWEHDMTREPPQMLSFHFQQPDSPNPAAQTPSLGNATTSAGVEPSASPMQVDGQGVDGSQQLTPNLFATQASQMYGVGAAAQRGSKADEEPELCGCIAAASLALGQVFCFRFTVKDPSVRLEVHAPRSTTRRLQAGAEANLGRILMRRLQQGDAVGAGTPTFGQHLTRPQDAGGSTPASKQGLFSWVPHASTMARSLDLPQRLALPLKERRHWEEHNFLRLYKRDLEEEDLEVLRSAADLQGLALVSLSASADTLFPSAQISPPSPPADSLLLRLDCMGDLYVDTCMLQKRGLSFRFSAEVPPQRHILEPLMWEPHPCVLEEEPSEEPGEQKKSTYPPPSKRTHGSKPIQDLLSKVSDDWLRATDPGEGQVRLFNDLGDRARDESLRAIQEGARLSKPLEEGLPPDVSLEEDVKLQRVLEELQVPLTVAEVYEDMQNLRLGDDKEGAESGGGDGAHSHRGWRFGQIPARARGGLQDPTNQRDLRMTPKALLAAEHRAQQELEEYEKGKLPRPEAMLRLNRHIAATNARNVVVSERVVPIRAPAKDAAPALELASLALGSQDQSEAGPSQPSQGLPWMRDYQASIGEAPSNAPGEGSDADQSAGLGAFVLVPCERSLGYGSVVHQVGPDKSVMGELIPDAPPVPKLSIRHFPEEMSGKAVGTLQRLEQKWLETELSGPVAPAAPVSETAPIAGTVPVAGTSPSQGAEFSPSLAASWETLTQQPAWHSTQPSQDIAGLLDSQGADVVDASQAWNEGWALSQEQPSRAALPPTAGTPKPKKKRRVVQEGFS